MILGTEIRPFTVYSLQSIDCAAKCCYQSESTRIICTLKGPDYSQRSLNNTIIIKTRGYEAQPALLELLQRILLSTIVLDSFQKACFTYEFDILQSPSHLFSELINLICYATCKASIPMKDLFVSTIVALVGQDIVIDPKPQQMQSKSVLLKMAYLPSKNKMIHLETQGKVNTNNIRKMLGLAVSGCKTIINFIEQKLTQKQ